MGTRSYGKGVVLRDDGYYFTDKYGTDNGPFSSEEEAEFEMKREQSGRKYDDDN